MMNYLSMSYEGNQLVKVTDDAYDPIDFGRNSDYWGAFRAHMAFFWHFFGKIFGHFRKKQYLCGKIGGVNLRMAV
ncbi:MAG: hypothetical protein IJS49_06535 [Paludibacteraceae bacterium]|nr:hypothetical protein [Paludibacteraceae bacterium]